MFTARHLVRKAQVSSLLDRDVAPFVGTGVIAGGADDLVVAPLLEDMGAPAGDAAGSEDAREQLGWNPHVMLEARRIEIDVAVLVDGFLDEPFELQRNVEPPGVAPFDAQPPRELLQVPGARVF